MRGLRVRGFLASVVGVVLVLVAGTGGPVAGQSLSPRPSAPDAVLERALAGIDELDAYRMEQRLTSPISGDLPVTTIMDVLRTPTFAVRYRVVDDDGQAGIDMISIDEQAWMNQFGRGWNADDGWSGGVDVGSLPLRLDTLVELQAAGIQLAQVGPETIDGRATLHYQGTIDPPLATPAPGEYYAQSISGTLDLWVDATDGFLVRSIADVIDYDSNWQDLLDDDTVQQLEQVDVTRVDDPTLAITAPEVAPSPTPMPSGDPAIAATLQAAFDALGEAESYRVSIGQGTSGFQAIIDLIVVNGPEPVVHARMRFGSRTFDDLVMTADAAWTRAEDGTWQSADDGTMSCGGGPCRAGSLTNLADGFGDRLGTFTLVADDATIDGEAAVHYRSEAGIDMPGLEGAPGIIDVWVAKDGGHVLRTEFDGHGIAMSAAVSGVNDPANVVEIPETSPAPSPLASPGV
jgi:hypothetical protein